MVNLSFMSSLFSKFANSFSFKIPSSLASNFFLSVSTSFRVYFKRKVSVRLLGACWTCVGRVLHDVWTTGRGNRYVYWTCIGRCMDSSQGNRYVYWTCIGRCVDNREGNRYVYWTCIGRCMENSRGNRSEQSPALEIKQRALIWETPKAVPSISTRSFVTGAPATQQERAWLVRKCSGNSLVCTTSVTASRPPGRSTRKDS